MSAPRCRSRTGNRFYNPPAVRQQFQHQQKCKQQSCHRPALVERTNTSADSDDRASTTSPASFSPYSAAGGDNNLSNLTNLDRFLKCTTPVVAGHIFYKTRMKGCSTYEDELQPYFMLGDLWESFHEWSAYGAGVPLLLHGRDYVKQYYVPYLSGIQLYVNPSIPAPRNRRLGEESDADSARESNDGSSNYETERGPKYSFRGIQNQKDLVEGIGGVYIHNKTSNSSSSDGGEFVRPPGVLKFEYLEHDPPFSREPLTTKMSLLASRFPELNTYRSCDLSPASWICVAWYPIYRIPTGPTLKNLDSCFLTFHSLCTPTPGSQNDWKCPYDSYPRKVPDGSDRVPKLSLPTFGLASFKFSAVFWEHTGEESTDKYRKANSLMQAADDWLQLSNVCLPDYNFFASRNSYRR